MWFISKHILPFHHSWLLLPKEKMKFVYLYSVTTFCGFFSSVFFAFNEILYSAKR